MIRLQNIKVVRNLFGIKILLGLCESPDADVCSCTARALAYIYHCVLNLFLLVGDYSSAGC